MKRLHRSTLNLASRSEEGVERETDSRAPTAFRIWRAGENKCDDGSIFFTAESAEKLLAEQASKDRPLSIDFDHLSLANDRPAEAGRAAGWHRIAARQTVAGPELWAENVEWSPDVRAGLEEEPPRWRFFSPAFYTDDDKQVTSYINLALCINPMTHGIPLLASRKLTKEAQMTADEMHAEMLAALDAIIEATDDPSQKAALQSARDALAKGGTEDAPPSDAMPAAASEKAEVTAHAEGGDDDKKDDDADKKSVTAHSAKAPDPMATLAAEVVELERRAEVGEIDALLAKHTNLPEEFRAHCRKGSLADAKVMVKTVIGVKTHSRKETPAQGSTNGTAAIDPREGEAIDRAMGMPSTESRAFFERKPDGTATFHNVRPSDLVRMNAQKAKA